MNYYIVFQNKSFEVEPDLEGVLEGDMIFTYIGGTIVSVGTVVKGAYPSKEPSTLNVQYEWLESKLSVKPIFSKIKELLGKEPTPFTKQGRHGVAGSLHRLNQECGQFIIERMLIS